MNYNLPIENLPFVIQREIMDLKPRLPKNKFIAKLNKHFSNRYCEKCGEYIDYKYKNNNYPKHLHYGRKKFTKNKYKYIGFYPIIYPFQLQDLKINAISISCYNIVSFKHIIPLKIYFLKNSTSYFFNFKKYINGKTKKILQMINLLNINIFKNPNFYYFENQNFNYDNRYFLGKYKKFDLINSENHYKKIINLFDKLFIYYYNDELFYKAIKNHRFILNYYAYYHPKETILSLLNYKYVIDEIYLKIIKINIQSIEYISEKKLIKLYNNNRSFFHDLQKKNKNVDNFFHFFDPIEDTLYFRLIMYEEYY